MVADYHPFSASQVQDPAVWDLAMLATLAWSVGYVQGGFAPRSAVSGAAQTARSAAVMQSPFMPPTEETRDAKGDAITSALSSSHTICTPTKRCAHWPTTRLTAPDMRAQTTGWHRTSAGSRTS